MKLQRSNQKRITRDALILRHMRITRKLSLNEAGKKVKISGSAIAHIEQGRMDVSKARLEALVNAYGFTKVEYLEFCDGKEIPKNLRDDCILLLRLCDEAKVRMLHPLILNLTK